MRKEERLTKNSQFATVYSKGKSWANALLALRVLPNGLDISRFGFAVGKRLGNAVMRNRVKRRLRQLAGSMNVGKGWDLVVIARKPAAGASYGDLGAALDELMKRGRLLEG